MYLRWKLPQIWKFFKSGSSERQLGTLILISIETMTTDVYSALDVCGLNQ